MKTARRAASRFIAGIVAAAIAMCAGEAGAERLPLKAYTTADGLARDQILRVVRDSRGLLWFCTKEGLSRFDGHTFTTYTTADGLPHRSVRDLLETKKGEYWIATGGGLVRLNPDRRAGAPLFTVVHDGIGRTRDVWRLFQDSTGIVWIGTSEGLLRLDARGSDVALHASDLDMPTTPDGRLVGSIAEDRDGSLWIGTRSAGLYRRFVDGRIIRYTTADGLPSDRVDALLVDSSGDLWAGTSLGLAQLVITPRGGRRIARVLGKSSGLAGDWVSTLLQDREGMIWVAAGLGLTRVEPQRGGGAPRIVRSYTSEHGIGDEINGIVEDEEGTLWLGTATHGVLRLPRTGVVLYGERDGLGMPVAGSIFADRNGTVCVYGDDRFARFDGERFVRVTPRFGKRITQYTFERRRIALQGRDGEVWIGTGEGLYRFPAVARVDDIARVPPKAVYRRGRGVDGDLVEFLYEDRRGDVWIQTDSGFHPVLVRWNRQADRIEAFAERSGWPAGTWVADAADDVAGNVWLAGTTLVRYRDGLFTAVKSIGAVNVPGASAVHVDAAGRLWIATDTAGLIRVDDPSRLASARQYTIGDGLSSDQVFNLTEDRWGRIYAVTGRGVDRLDPSTGALRHYTTADGIAPGPLAFADSTGALWFGTNETLSRLAPTRENAHARASVWIGGVSVAGVPTQIAELGAVAIPNLDLASGQRQVSIDFFGIGGSLLYQYRLDASSPIWSKPTSERTVHYASLAPGRYQFEVRAIDPDAGITSDPASVRFTIPPPLWLRWWFIGLMASMAGTVIYTGYRYRVGQLLEMERMRTRIATDLHDDIGASLSRVSVLTAVIRQRLQAADEEAAMLLSEIAESSRSLVDSLRDIVWAIDSRQDTIADVATRIRQFAGSVFDATGTSWRMAVGETAGRLELDSEQRRHVLLFFKEAIHNAARHAHARSVLLELSADHVQVVCRVTDDGSGFDTDRTPAAAAARGSRGLANMSARAAQLGGEFQMRSAPRQGTVLTMAVPFRRYPSGRMNMRWPIRRGSRKVDAS